MKVKIFKNQSPATTENNINIWLISHNGKIHFVKQTLSKEGNLIISVWYDEKRILPVTPVKPDNA